MHKKIVHRKLFKTSDLVVHFALSNHFTIVECGGNYLYCHNRDSFTEADLRHYYVNDNITAAYNCFDSFKLKPEQIEAILNDKTQAY